MHKSILNSSFLKHLKATDLFLPLLLGLYPSYLILITASLSPKTKELFQNYFFLSSIIIFIFIILGFWKTLKFQVNSPLNPKTVANILGVIIFLTIIGHLYFLKVPPVILSAFEDIPFKITLYRQSIKELTPSLFAYFSSITIKVFIPILLYICIKEKRKNFFIAITVLASFYSLSLMQKSYPILIFAPIVLILFLKKSYLGATFMACLIVLQIYSLVVITNPQIRPNSWNDWIIKANIFKDQRESYHFKAKLSEEMLKEKSEPLDTLAESNSTLINRLTNAPAKVANYWLLSIPQNIPHSGVCGIKNLARFFPKCTFIDYQSEIYKKMNPQYYQIGFNGNATTVAVVFDYALFGKKGFIIHSLFLGIFFLLIAGVLKNKSIELATFHFPFILAIMENNLYTTIASGGWLLLVAIQYFSFPSKK